MKGEFITVTQTKSSIGRLSSHKGCLRGLGIRRLGHSVTVKCTPENLGMVRKVSYMLKVESANVSE